MNTMRECNPLAVPVVNEPIGNPPNWTANKVAELESSGGAR